jgi:GH24 family phage-related lysozyme (muramidase)
MTIQKLSREGATALAIREGIRENAYYDSVGKLTVGVGHLVRQQDWVTFGWDRSKGISTWKLPRKQVLELFALDACSREAAVTMAAGGKVIDQRIFDAIVSFVFNVGEAVLTRPWMKKGLRTQDKKVLAAGMMLYLKPVEITKRRKGEVASMSLPPIK